MNFLSSNFLHGNINDLKKFSIITTRPDLNIKQKVKLQYFSPDELQNLNNYDYESFSYDINEFGFRGSDFPVSIDLGAFGCSFTFGQGLSNNHLWHTLVANHNSYNSYNFGQPAIGAEAIMKIFAIVIRHVKMNHAIFLLPPYHRLNIAVKHKEEIIEIPVIPNTQSRFQQMFNLDSDKIYTCLPMESNLKTFRDAVYLIEFLGDIGNVKTYFSSWDYDTYNVLVNMRLKNVLPIWEGGGKLISDFARDQFHPGPLHHFTWANKIKEFIK